MNMKSEIEIAMDLGSANAIIIHDNQIIVEEPTIIGIDCNNNKMVAFGKEAKQMQGKVHSNIRITRPFCEGIITSYRDSELLIKGLLKALPPDIYPSSIKMAISIPSNATEVERHALKYVCEKSGINKVFMIEGPMAAALGIGIDIEQPKGSMIIDIGGGITDMAIISLGGIVANKSVKIGGDNFTKDVIKHIKHKHNFSVSGKTAELIKNNIGISQSNMSEDYTIHLSSLTEFSVKPGEIAICLEKSICSIEDTIVDLFEKIPPELFQDLIESGIWLTGGGSLLRGIDKHLSNTFGIKFKIVDNPLHAVVQGVNLILQNFEKYSYLIK